GTGLNLTKPSFYLGLKSDSDFCSPTVLQLKCHMRSVYRWQKSWVNLRALRGTPDDVWADLERWMITLARYNGILWITLPPDLSRTFVQLGYSLCRLLLDAAIMQCNQPWTNRKTVTVTRLSD
ncbi:hypothetical protein VP01_3349g1, partial [Puccinia sorghi]